MSIWWDSRRLSGQKPTSTSPFCISFALPNQAVPTKPQGMASKPAFQMSFCQGNLSDCHQLGCPTCRSGKETRGSPKKSATLKVSIFPIPKNAIDWGVGGRTSPSPDRTLSWSRTRSSQGCSVSNASGVTMINLAAGRQKTALRPTDWKWVSKMILYFPSHHF